MKKAGWLFLAIFYALGILINLEIEFLMEHKQKFVFGAFMCFIIGMYLLIKSK